MSMQAQAERDVGHGHGTMTVHLTTQSNQAGEQRSGSVDQYGLAQIPPSPTCDVRCRSLADRYAEATSRPHGNTLSHSCPSIRPRPPVDPIREGATGDTHRHVCGQAADFRFLLLRV